MKKILLISLLLVASIVTKVSAQLFVGGSLNLNTSKEKYSFNSTTQDGQKTFSIGFMPKVGYIINNKLAFGVGFGLSSSKTTTPKEISTSGEEEIDKSFDWAFSPFARYYFARSGNFSLFGEADLALGGGNSKSSIGGTTDEGPKSITVLIGVSPAVSYDLSNKFTIEASMGGINYNVTTSKQTIGEDKEKYTTSGFNFTVGLNNLTFGGIFKF